MKKETDWMAYFLRITFVVLFFGLIYGFDSSIINSENENSTVNVVESRISAMPSEEFSHIESTNTISVSSTTEQTDLKMDLNNAHFQKIIIIGLTAIVLVITLLVFCEIASRV